MEIALLLAHLSPIAAKNRCPLNLLMTFSPICVILVLIILPVRR